MSMTGKQRKPVAGEVPSPLNPPQGCGFHPRCPHANKRCRGETPRILKIGDVHVACHALEEARMPDWGGTC